MSAHTKVQLAKLSKYPAMLLVLFGVYRSDAIMMMAGFVLAMIALAVAFYVTRRTTTETNQSSTDKESK